MEDPNDFLQRFSPFLKEIRKRLIFVSVLFLTFSVLGFIYYAKVIRFILNLFKFEGVNIVFTSPFQFIELAVNSGLIVGMVVALPLLIFQVMSFLKPALRKSEYKIANSLIPISMFLFTVGFGLGLYIMRFVISLFYERSMEFEIGNLLDISLLLSQTLLTAFLMGAAFQFPIILTLLIRLKVIEYKSLVKQRILAYSLSIFFAALLPPTDLISLILLTLPLIVLFEFTLLLNKVLPK